MALDLSYPKRSDFRPRVAVLGVGGAGGNSVNNMIQKNLEGVEFMVANTDAQVLQNSKASYQIQLGEERTGGLGAGALPEVGKQSVDESKDIITDALKGYDLVFIAAGMGGGTGTGAAPEIAKISRDLGVLTVGVVTKPFAYEGLRRMKVAEEGIANLQEYVDTLLVIPNQNLFLVTREDTTAETAYAMVDDILYHGVKGITDLMARPGRINLDFADIRTVMKEGGRAIMGTGEASGEGRAVEAAKKAISNQLLDELNLKGATGVLVNIIGKTDEVTLYEIEDAARHINGEISDRANIVYGTSYDDNVEGVQVCVLATGVGLESAGGADDDDFWKDGRAYEKTADATRMDEGGSFRAREAVASVAEEAPAGVEAAGADDGAAAGADAVASLEGESTGDVFQTAAGRRPEEQAIPGPLYVPRPREADADMNEAGDVLAGEASEDAKGLRLVGGPRAYEMDEEPEESPHTPQGMFRGLWNKLRGHDDEGEEVRELHDRQMAIFRGGGEKEDKDNREHQAWRSALNSDDGADMQGEREESPFEEELETQGFGYRPAFLRKQTS